jgi:type I restriction enzyme S subunit
VSSEELPPGWVATQLADVTIPKVRQREPIGQSFTYVDIGGVDRSTKTIAATTVIPTDAAPSRARQELREGDVLVSTVRPNLNAVARVQPELDGATGSTGFDVLRGTGAAESCFLYYFVQTPAFVEEMSSLVQGALYPAVRSADVRAVGLPLPPLGEQRRIVAKLDELRSRSRRAREALDDVPALLDKLKQSVLAAAFRGDLTAEWRAAQPPGSVEPASVLLDRIRAERRKRWEQANPKKEYVEPEPVDTDGLPDLPDGWCWVNLDEVSAGFDYGTSAKSDNAGLIPVLRMGNLQGGEIDWSDLKYTSDPVEIERYSLSPNTVLFNRTNSPELVGKTAIYRGDRPAVFAGYLIRIDLLQEVQADYVNLSLDSLRAREWCWRVKTDGVSQSNISAGKLRQFPLPLCPEREQQAIVQLARSALDAVVRLGTSVATIEEEADKLDQSILAKAFRGELVPQDPNDEPAETLLARIQAEAGDGGPKKPGRGRKPNPAHP